MARHRTKPFIPTSPDKSCGKNRYASKKEAEAVAREQEMHDLSGNLKLKVYHCMGCGGWHLTSHTGAIY